MNLITDFLANSAVKYPKKTCLITHDEELTFQELQKQTNDFSAGLKKFPNQSIISILFENSSEFIISYLGILNAACIAHIIPSGISQENLQTQIKSAKPNLVISSKNFLNKFKNVEINEIKEFSEVPSNNIDFEKRKISPDDFAYLIYTSGTTSLPKGVGITHRNTVFTTNNIVKVLGYTSKDIDVVPLPLFHSFGLGCFHTSLFTGSTFVLQKNPTNIQDLLNTLEKYNATTFSAVPTTLTKIIKDIPDNNLNILARLRLIMTNSTAIPPNTVIDLKKILKKGNLATYYGLTEASRSTFMIFDSNGKEESVGLPAPEVKIKLIDDDEKIGNKGNIWISGPNVINNYWKNPNFDKNIIDGWLKTDDIGYLDSDGFLYLTGRQDDIINVAGEKVIPQEVEKVVLELNEIEEVIAIGIKHEVFGQVVKLFVQKTRDASIGVSEIMSHCIKNLERYKVPLKIDFVNEFPRTEYGKIKRFQLGSE